MFPGRGGHKNPNALDALSAAKDYPANVSQEQKVTEDKRAERKAKGNTMAIPYKYLQAYLPDVCRHTKDGGTKGSQMNMMGMGSLSTEEQEYTNGDKHLTVYIVGNNYAYQAFVGATAPLNWVITCNTMIKSRARPTLALRMFWLMKTLIRKTSRVI